MVDVVETLLGFLLGLVSGAFLQHLRFRYSLKAEKVRRLTPILEAVYPIIDHLSGDSTYARSIQIRGDDDEFKRVLQKVSHSLEEYEEWFKRFQLAGVSTALESVDSDLLARFNGIFTHTRLCKLHGLAYLSQNMEEFAEYCQRCKNRLKTRLSR
jgi:hypothetical protein